MGVGEDELQRGNREARVIGESPVADVVGHEQTPSAPTWRIIPSGWFGVGWRCPSIGARGSRTTP
jgi:hypothetical protein